MHARVRRGLTTGAALVASCILGLVLLGPASIANADPISATDPAGDTVTDAVEEPITAPRADIVSTAAESGPAGIVLSTRVSQLLDPMKDPNWSGEGLLSFVTWTIDVTGDGKRDFEIEYAMDSDTQALAGSLYRFGSSFRPPEGCDPPASFNPEAGYTVTVDPKCFGNPAAFSYQVEVSYNTDVKDDAADVATDRSPNQGWTGPVTVTLPAGVTPETLPTTTSTTGPAPSETPTSPVAGRAPTPAPTQGQAGATAPTSPKPVKPQQAPGPRSADASPGASSAPAPDLARTGVGDRTLRMAGFAFGIALIGVGLLFANRRPSLR